MAILSKQQEEAVSKLGAALDIEPDDLLSALQAIMQKEEPEGSPSADIARSHGYKFFRCSQTCHGPVLDENGERQMITNLYQSQPRPFEAMRTWAKGKIYPFRSLKQLPVKLAKVLARDMYGKVIFEKNPLDPNPYAPPVPRYEMVNGDTEAAIQAQVTGSTIRTEVVGVEHFEEVIVPDDVVISFLQGSNKSGIVNPVNNAKIAGNYQNRMQRAERTLTQRERAQQLIDLQTESAGVA